MGVSEVAISLTFDIKRKENISLDGTTSLNAVTKLKNSFTDVSFIQLRKARYSGGGYAVPSRSLQ